MNGAVRLILWRLLLSGVLTVVALALRAAGV